MSKWKTILGKLATVGKTAAGAALETYTGGAIPATVITHRKKFAQWPPRPDEVEAGEGGGVTQGVSRDQLEVLGELWLGCPNRPTSGAGTVQGATVALATAAAVAHMAKRFGWGDANALRPADLEPDQYYTGRHWLQEWVRTGMEPDWPRLDAVDHNARHAEYQQAVREVNRPWVPPAQPQGEQGASSIPRDTQPAPAPAFETNMATRWCRQCYATFTADIETANGPEGMFCEKCRPYVVGKP